MKKHQTIGVSVQNLSVVIFVVELPPASKFHQALLSFLVREQIVLNVKLMGAWKTRDLAETTKTL
jgi:hypothetical protein